MPCGGTGDVKYHYGAFGSYKTPDGRTVKVTLSPTPSHLEYIDPVVEGRARADQSTRDSRELAHDPTLVLPVLIHGDAAFPAQGIVAETLNLQALPGYATGGSSHIITNNQLGFTPDPEEGAAMAEDAYRALAAAHEELRESLAEGPDTGEHELDRTASPEPRTEISAETARSLNEELLRVPEGFEIHRKLRPQLERRRA